jgi:outer membrane protein
MTPLTQCQILLAVAAAILVVGDAHAQAEPRFFIRGGPAFSTFDASATVKVAGSLVPGGSASVKNNTGLALEGGWFLRPDWAVSLTLGVPPKARINGDGTLAAAGLLGTVRYGPSALGLQYHVPTARAFRPYIGGGASYTLVYRVRDSAIRNLTVSDGFGPFIQAGAEYRLTDRAAVFADVKKIWVSVEAKGVTDTPAGAFPATARVQLDPVIANAGLSFHF